jgi:hypothetical protein
MGLLLSHKRKLRVWNDMLSVSGIHENEPAGGGKRGEVSIFSAASRYRLFRQLHQLKFKTVTFITLTYPGEFPVESRIYKANLKEWRRRFESSFGPIRAIWRLEFQARGAPHFHIMYLDCPFIPVYDLCYLWKSVVHTFDMAHEVNGVDLKLITDGGQQALIASYLAKYIAKIDGRTGKNEFNHVGRWWGRWNIVDQEPLEFEVSDREAERIVTTTLGSRLGNQQWEPMDPTLCSVFGSGMGSDEFGKFVSGLATFERSSRKREPD